jgi:predicted DCC family thiol-disulfide oxidoreductase YuxK
MTTPSNRQATVLYDGRCPLCQSSVRSLKRLDWRHKLKFLDARQPENVPVVDPPLDPARLLEEMHLVTPDRKRVYHGFGAFRWMAWRIPLFFLLAPLLYVPGVPTLGQWIYLKVARNRFNLVPCKDGICTIHRPPVQPVR